MGVFMLQINVNKSPERHKKQLCDPIKLVLYCIHPNELTFIRRINKMSLVTTHPPFAAKVTLRLTFVY